MHTRICFPALVVSLTLALACASAPASAPPPDPSAAKACDRPPAIAIAEALDGAHRSEKNRARDVYRHPRETLLFMGVTPSMNVVELWPGSGWYTEVLAPLLKGCGHLTSVAKKNSDAYRAMIAANPGVYGEVEVRDVEIPGGALVPDGTADLVLTFRNVHNWMNGGFEADVYAAAFKALKQGGVFGVVEHRAKPGADIESSKTSGYVDEAALIARVQAAGFVLEEKSEINANPKDTKDYEKGVWTLPPVLTLGDTDREKYVAIGESDRMTLRFRKPATTP